MPCNPELCNKRQLLIKLQLNNTFQLHLSLSAIEKKSVTILLQMSVMMQLEGDSKDVCAGVGKRSQQWNKNLFPTHELLRPVAIEKLLEIGGQGNIHHLSNYNWQVKGHRGYAK